MKFTIRALTLPVLSFEYRLFKPWSQRKLDRLNQELAKLQPLLEAYIAQTMYSRGVAAEAAAVEAIEEAPVEPPEPVDGSVDPATILKEAKKAKELTDHAYEAGKKAGLAEAAAATRARRGELQLADYIDCIQEDDDSITLLVETDNGRFRVATGHHGERAVIVTDDDNETGRFILLWSSLTDVG